MIQKDGLSVRYNVLLFKPLPAPKEGLVENVAEN